MHRSRHAFTLVELLVALTIAVLVLGAVLSVFLSVNRSLFGLSDAVALNARTRVIQERVAFDLRSIKTLTAIGSQSFSGTFVDFATGLDRTITYAFAPDGTLTRSVDSGPATVVMRDLVTDTTAGAYSFFEYSNRRGALGAPTTINKDEVRAIKFDLVPRPTARQRLRLVPGTSDPFCSALFQLRNRQS